MYPVGTEVEYEDHIGVVNFCDEQSGCCTICIKVIPDDIPRQVCIVVYKHDFHKIKLINGNQKGRS